MRRGIDGASRSLRNLHAELKPVAAAAAATAAAVRMGQHSVAVSGRGPGAALPGTSSLSQAVTASCAVAAPPADVQAREDAATPATPNGCKSHKESGSCCRSPGHAGAPAAAEILPDAAEGKSSRSNPGTTEANGKSSGAVPSDCTPLLHLRRRSLSPSARTQLPTLSPAAAAAAAAEWLRQTPLITPADTGRRKDGGGGSGPLPQEPAEDCVAAPAAAARNQRAVRDRLTAALQGLLANDKLSCDDGHVGGCIGGNEPAGIRHRDEVSGISRKDGGAYISTKGCMLHSHSMP